jgi:hypothetical protein
VKSGSLERFDLGVDDRHLEFLAGLEVFLQRCQYLQPGMICEIT